MTKIQLHEMIRHYAPKRSYILKEMRGASFVYVDGVTREEIRKLRAAIAVRKAVWQTVHVEGKLVRWVWWHRLSLFARKLCKRIF